MRKRLSLVTLIRWCTAVFMAFGLAASSIASPQADALRAKQAALADQLAHNAFHRPLHLESTQNAGDLQGDIVAIVDHPFRAIEGALKGADVWCDILILHLNVKYCKASGGPPANLVALSVGKKFDQPLADAYTVNFVYTVESALSDYLKLSLSAKEGPLGTSNYRIFVEAAPLDANRSVIHMSYAYGYGFAARMAMQGYLATIGRGKVGFSVVGKNPDGQPVYIDNVRGVVERNTMRYYLAIDIFLASLALPPDQRQERRLHDWFAATERYARQLHEMEQEDYLAMKRKEIARQRTPL